MVSDLLTIRGARRPHLVLAAWSAMAAANIGFAIYLSLHPGWLKDIWMVREWLLYFRTEGNPYPAFALLDYPPNALLLFYPLSLLSSGNVPYLLPVILVSAMAAATVLLARWLADLLAIELRWFEVAALVAMVLGKSSMRTAIWLGNPAPLVLLLGAMALYWARRRPVAAMVALALCAAKPHVAIGFGLAMVVMGRGRYVAGAMAIAVAKSAVFAVMVGTPLLSLFTTYLQNLATIYSGPDSINGLMSVEFVIDDFVGPPLDTYVLVALAVSSLWLIVSNARRQRDSAVIAKLAAACLLWSLAFLPHQIYHGMMAAPAVWLVMFRASLLAPAWRFAALAAIAAITVADVPRVLRISAAYLGDADLVYDSYYIRPLMIVSLLALVIWAAATRVRRQAEAMQPV